jgi:3-polyprenyl-4-hydroxybenzoate decarboxylase
LPQIVAITGAIGVICGAELLRVLRALGQPTHLSFSQAAGMKLAIHRTLGKALDRVGIEHGLFRRWAEHGADAKEPQRTSR